MDTHEFSHSILENEGQVGNGDWPKIFNEISG